MHAAPLSSLRSQHNAALEGMHCTAEPHLVAVLVCYRADATSQQLSLTAKLMRACWEYGH